MTIRSMLLVLLLAFSVNASAGDETQRAPSAEGAAVGFSNLADGDTVAPGFIVKFSISGMGIAPAGVEIENTGHHHLLIDLAELPDLDQPLPFAPNILHFEESQAEVALELPEGQHRLQLLLADHAQLPHEPPVMSEPVTINVSADAIAPDPAEQE